MKSLHTALLLSLTLLSSCYLPKEYKLMSGRFYPSSKRALRAMDSSAEAFVETKDHQIIEGNEMVNGNTPNSLLMDDVEYKFRKLYAYQDDIGYHRMAKRQFLSFSSSMPVTRVYTGKLNVYSKDAIIVNTSSNGNGSTYTTVSRILLTYFEDPSERKLYDMHRIKKLEQAVADNERASKQVARYKKHNTLNKLAIYGGYAAGVAGVVLAITVAPVVGVPVFLAGGVGYYAGRQTNIRNDVHLYKALLIYNGLPVKASSAEKGQSAEAPATTY